MGQEAQLQRVLRNGSGRGTASTRTRPVDRCRGVRHGRRPGHQLRRIRPRHPVLRRCRVDRRLHEASARRRAHADLGTDRPGAADREPAVLTVVGAKATRQNRTPNASSDSRQRRVS
ncbi:hypothetical protein RHCRD62_10655 [Rhodococcus sp. RD6.2]|nr:hypothetical protein RHCRD62_10655 [Rhodococcus sp. RD6.2]